VEELRKVIARLSFVRAKTYPFLPHEYTVREQATNPEDFQALAEAIVCDGRLEYFGKNKDYYLYPGDGWRYWLGAGRMSTTPDNHRIINRNTLAAAQRLRERGVIRDA
jgi:hypothetical protein